MELKNNLVNLDPKGACAFAKAIKDKADRLEFVLVRDPECPEIASLIRDLHHLSRELYKVVFGSY